MGVKEKYFQDILYYEIEGFNQYKNISHLFSSRIGWNQKNIFKSLSKILNIPDEKIYRAKQVHGKNVIIIDNQDNKIVEGLEADGLVTNIPGIALCTFHADCVPIYFYDRVKKVIGIAHAGWKGTLNNIVEVVVNKLVEVYQSNVDDISAAIGPSIGVCCYEIGEDVEKLFKDKFSNSEIIIQKDGRIYLDLWKANTINLLNSGIKCDNIYLSNSCTGCNLSTLYSYRKEKGTKNRMIASIILKY